MGYLYWTQLAALELQRRKRQLETVLRLAGDDLAARHRVSRKFIYQQTDKARLALDDAFLAAGLARRDSV